LIDEKQSFFREIDEMLAKDAKIAVDILNFVLWFFIIIS